VTLKVVPKAACDPENCSEAGHEYTGENRPMRAKESCKRNLMRLSEQSLELSQNRKKTEKSEAKLKYFHTDPSWREDVQMYKYTLLGPYFEISLS
jgi:hypothetical protein